VFWGPDNPPYTALASISLCLTQQNKNNTIDWETRARFSPSKASCIGSAYHAVKRIWPYPGRGTLKRKMLSLLEHNLIALVRYVLVHDPPEMAPTWDSQAQLDLVLFIAYIFSFVDRCCRSAKVVQLDLVEAQLDLVLFIACIFPFVDLTRSAKVARSWPKNGTLASEKSSIW